MERKDIQRVACAKGAMNQQESANAKCQMPNFGIRTLAFEI
jgi:hypothetical protein